MSPKKEGRKFPPGPFRGSPPSKIYQTVDLGSGTAAYIKRQATKFKKRKYAAVDPTYGGPHGFYSSRYDVHVSLYELGVDSYPTTFEEFIDIMKKDGLKTRHLNIDMPTFISPNSTKGFVQLLKNLPHILIPNGKIYITSEMEDVIKKTGRLAMEHGLRVRRFPALNLDRIEVKKTLTMKGYAEQKIMSIPPIYRLEITYGLKKAVLDKKQRKKWPQL